MKKHPPENAHELQVCTEMRAFARLILPIYETEYQRQITSSAPCWMFLSILERRMRELEKQAR
jgi:hypothetical protein